jgi:azurin
MKPAFIPTLLTQTIAIVALSLSLGGCGDKGGGSAAAPESSAPGRAIAITADDKMKFDVTEIKAKAGERLSITLKDVGTTPKFSMGHNFTLLQKGTDPAKFVDASSTAASTDYIAPDLKTKVIAHTKLLGPGESDTVTFNAPQIPDQYDFLCTYPGHFAVGMRGKLIVTP